MDTKIEAFFNSISGKTIALCGIGRSHLPLIPLFTKYGAKVIACDRRSREQLGSAADEAEKNGAVLSLGDGYINDLDVDIFFRTPGMKFFTPEIEALRERGVVVTSEMEVFFDICPCKIIGITGSDGKTTTTTVTSLILKKQAELDGSDRKIWLGGNIGVPLIGSSFRPAFDVVGMERISPFVYSWRGL